MTEIEEMTKIRDCMIDHMNKLIKRQEIYCLIIDFLAKQISKEMKKEK